MRSIRQKISAILPWLGLAAVSAVAGLAVFGSSRLHESVARFEATRGTIEFAAFRWPDATGRHDFDTYGLAVATSDEARRRLDGGDIEAALAGVRELRRVATSLERERFLVPVLLGAAVERRELALLEGLVTRTGDLRVASQGRPGVPDLLALVPAEDLAVAKRRVLRYEASALPSLVERDLAASGAPRFLVRSAIALFGDLMVAERLDALERADRPVGGRPTAAQRVVWSLSGDLEEMVRSRLGRIDETAAQRQRLLRKLADAASAGPCAAAGPARP